MSKNDIIEKTISDIDVQRPDWIAAGVQRGSEEVTHDDITIPRVSIIQALSPQRSSRKPEYIEGCAEGDLFNTVTGEIYGTSHTVVPVYFRKEYIIWKKREAGGGFVGVFPTQQEAYDACEHAELKMTEHEIQETAQHFCLWVDDHQSENPRVEEVVLSMAKSRLRASRNLNTLVKMSKEDRFARGYIVSTFEAEGPNGEPYFNWKIDSLGYVSRPVYTAALATYNAIREGMRDVDRSVMEE